MASFSLAAARTRPAGGSGRPAAMPAPPLASECGRRRGGGVALRCRAWIPPAAGEAAAQGEGAGVKETYVDVTTGDRRPAGAVAPTTTPERRPTPTLATTLAALALAGAALGLAPAPPAHADLQTVTLQEATSAAKPLPQQPVKTGRVWAMIGLGAAGVFGAAIAVENNEAWFPAIAKANKAMAATKARAAGARAEATGSGADAVAAGIAEASRRAREGGDGKGETRGEQ